MSISYIAKKEFVKTNTVIRLVKDTEWQDYQVRYNIDGKHVDKLTDFCGEDKTSAIDQYNYLCDLESKKNSVFKIQNIITATMSDDDGTHYEPTMFKNIESAIEYELSCIKQRRSCSHTVESFLNVWTKSNETEYLASDDEAILVEFRTSNLLTR